VPDGARTAALGLLQILSASATSLPACSSSALTVSSRSRHHARNGWRWMFLLGVAPAFLRDPDSETPARARAVAEIEGPGRLPAAGLLTPYRLLLREAGGEKTSSSAPSSRPRRHRPLALANMPWTFKSGVRELLPRRRPAPELVKVKTANAITWAYLSPRSARGGMARSPARRQVGRRPAFAVGFTARWLRPRWSIGK